MERNIGRAGVQFLRGRIYDCQRPVVLSGMIDAERLAWRNRSAPMPRSTLLKSAPECDAKAIRLIRILAVKNTVNDYDSFSAPTVNSAEGTSSI